MDINMMQLLLDDHVDVKEFGRIYHPKIEFIKDCGEEGYSKLLLPFALTLDAFEIKEEHKSNVKMFDLFFQPIEFISGISLQDNLLTSLYFFFRVEPRVDMKNYCIWVNEKMIHRENFDKLADIILHMCKAEKIVIEKPPEFANERQRDIYNKITEGRKRKREKDKISLATVVSIVMNGGVFCNYISPEIVGMMTYYQLINRYEFLCGTESWDVNFKQALSFGTDGSKLDLTHWIAKIKL